MGVFNGFGVWNNLNTQQPLQADFKNVTSKSASEKDSSNINNQELYFDKDEQLKQGKLWRDAQKKHPWYDAPPRVKVTTKNGLCHMNIELTLGLPPETVYELVSNPNNGPFFDMDKTGRQLLENKSRKVLKKDGPRQTAKLEKAVAWNFLWWSGTIPINLIVDENQKDFTAKYKKEKMMFMEVFEGSYKVEPLYVDQERLCKQRLPKSREEYRKCSGGQGKIASKVIMDQYFQTSSPFNLPPLSWYIREKTIKTTKTLLQMLQYTSATMREN